MTAKTKAQAGTTERVPLSELRLITRNPRKGNVGAVAASLKHNDQYRPLVVNIGTHTGRANEVLKGNHTLKAMRALAKRDPNDERWHTALVHWVDYDEEQLKAVVLVDNKTSELGSYDHDVLGDQLRDMDDLAGTGFTASDLAGFAPVVDDFSTDLDSDALVDFEDEPEDPDDQVSGRGNQVISFSIVFDSVDQRARWTEFVNWLKRQHPDLTPAERLDAYLHDLAERMDSE